jgi:hypothetical protein
VKIGACSRNRRAISRCATSGPLVRSPISSGRASCADPRRSPSWSGRWPPPSACCSPRPACSSRPRTSPAAGSYRGSIATSGSCGSPCGRCREATMHGERLTATPAGPSRCGASSGGSRQPWSMRRTRAAWGRPSRSRRWTPRPGGYGCARAGRPRAAGPGAARRSSSGGRPLRRRSGSTGSTSAWSVAATVDPAPMGPLPPPSGALGAGGTFYVVAGASAVVGRPSLAEVPRLYTWSSLVAPGGRIRGRSTTCSQRSTGSKHGCPAPFPAPG